MDIAGRQPFLQEIRRTAKIEVTGSFSEGLLGMGAAVLAIIALFGAMPGLLAPIGTIAIGAAFFLHGGSMGARYNRLAALTTENKYQANEFGGSISVEMLGGIAGIALGILALLGIAVQILIASAVVVFGASLIIGAGAVDRLNQMASAVWNEESVKKIANNASQTVAGLQVLVGVSAVALGVLALAGIYPFTLCLVALLSLGASDFLTGSAISTGIYRAFR